MKNTSRWFLLIGLLLAIPPAHADGTRGVTFQSPTGLKDGSPYTNFGLDNLANAKPESHRSQTAPQTYGEADGLSSQIVVRPHGNWIVRTSHREEGVVAAPEPSMLFMLGMGLVTVGFFTRRKLGGTPLGS